MRMSDERFEPARPPPIAIYVQSLQLTTNQAAIGALFRHQQAAVKASGTLAPNLSSGGLDVGWSFGRLRASN